MGLPSSKDLLPGPREHEVLPLFSKSPKKSVRRCCTRLACHERQSLLSPGVRLPKPNPGSHLPSGQVPGPRATEKARVGPTRGQGCLFLAVKKQGRCQLSEHQGTQRGPGLRPESPWAGPSQVLPEDSHTEQHFSGAGSPDSDLTSGGRAGYSSGPGELQRSGLALLAPRVPGPGTDGSWLSPLLPVMRPQRGRAEIHPNPQEEDLTQGKT